MDSVPLPKRDALSIGPETPTTKLIEAGFLSIRQGRDAEGLAFFALARERLSAEQARFALVLDAFTHSHTIYSQAREELLQASKHFASAEAEQQAQLVMLEALVQHVLEESQHTAPDIHELQQNVREHPLLYVLRPASEDFNNSQSSTQRPRRNASNRGKQSASSPAREEATLPALYITCFGHFEVKRLGEPIILCSNRHAQTILRYLIAQADHSASSDTLMALLWPEDEPIVVQPRLHTAICALRRSLNDGYPCESGRGYIVCENRTYFLNPTIQIQTDVEQFLLHYHAGRQTSAERVTLYEKACRLYSGAFLPEDRYADWSSLQRERLSSIYIGMCRILTEHYLKVKNYEDAAMWATALLAENHCDELAYQQLIQVYAAQGRRSEALQQYQQCERMLREELAVGPLPETVHIVQMLLNGDDFSANEEEI